MKNAHLRFGWLTYFKRTERTTTTFKLRLDRFIGEVDPDPPRQARAHFLSVIGADTQIAAVNAAISLGDRFEIEGPGVERISACLDRNAQTSKGALLLADRKKPLRHLIGVSEEFATSSASTGRVLLADSTPEFLWASVATIHGLPGIPDWANWFYHQLLANKALTRLVGIGCQPVLVKGSKGEFLSWLSRGVRRGELEFPSRNGPIQWRNVTLGELFANNTLEQAHRSVEVSPEASSPRCVLSPRRAFQYLRFTLSFPMPELDTIYSYLRAWSDELGQRILQEFPALHRFEDPVSPRIDALLRRPFPAQSIAIMGVAKRWQEARTAKVVAECGTGKTLISLGAIHVHSDGRPYTALAMVPPHLVEKWAREAFLTIPGIRVFLIDDMRNGGDEKAPHGINEVHLKRGAIAREGLRTSLSDLRLRKQYTTARDRWQTICRGPALFIVGRERAKLGYFWRHAYKIARSGPYVGWLVNPETGKPVLVDNQRITAADFKLVKLSESIDQRGNKHCRSFHSPLWQADRDKIHRMAPIEFIGRAMRGWFDYAICDEVHQLAGDTAQGNALGTLASCAHRIVGLTGTLLGGYADDLFNTLFRLEPEKMKAGGYEWGTAGRSCFTQDYGVLETITKIEPAENACSKARTTTIVRRKPGASPLLFGQHLMQLCAFVFLEDISSELPPYEERLVSVPMDGSMLATYRALEEDIRKALKEHRGNRSVLSQMLNTLLLYPDHPFGLGTLYGTEFDPEVGGKVRFVIAETQDLPEDFVYAKERRLIEEIKKELAQGRRCQVFAVYTQKHDVTRRLERILTREGIRTVVLRSNVDTSKREAWYARQVKQGVQVVITHPKIVETGLDLLDFPTLIFAETGYSLHTLRQASRRSWRIGQKKPVRVLFMCYDGTMQTSCLRLMGKKLLVALTMEGKFAGEGLQTIDEDDDMLSAMARELVEKNGIGETADAVWRAINTEHQERFPATVLSNEEAAMVEAPFAPDVSQPEAPNIVAGVDSSPIFIFGQRPEALAGRRKRSRPPVPEQASLFSL